jgi:hypothetical protein
MPTSPKTTSTGHKSLHPAQKAPPRSSSSLPIPVRGSKQTSGRAPRGGGGAHRARFLQMYDTTTHPRELLLHTAQGLNIPGPLICYGSGIIIDVLLGINAPQVAAHGERLAERVCHNTVACHIDNVCGQTRMGSLQQERQRRCIACNVVALTPSS